MMKTIRDYRPLYLGITIGYLLFSTTLLAEGAEEERQKTALSVEVSTVTQGLVTEFVFADGNAQSLKREFLLFENSGRVAYLKSNDDGGPLREGDAVKQGELLAELDRRIDNASANAARAELDTVRATLTNARTEFERAKRLKEGDAIQDSRFNAIETEYQQALASVRAAEARSDQALAGLRQLQLRAPFDGVVAFVNIREGQFYSPEQFDGTSAKHASKTSPIVVIDPSAFEILVELPVASGRQVRVGQNAFILDAGALAHVQEYGFDPETGTENIDALMIKGRVGSVSPAIDPGSRSVRARIIIDEKVEGLTDGGYAKVWIEIKQRQNAVNTPLESIVYRGEKAYAFVVDPSSNTVKRRTLTLGIIGEGGAEVKDGLSPGDIVVTKGRFRLTNDMPVRYSLDNKAASEGQYHEK
ncbi:hypothetical protein XV92_01575 [Vibrio metoecus]|uniref:Efflux RND transporter periplasmic adaptor subunit n=2 Tax=Vibrio metoecus TaxID=1481663 RepID=A0A0Q0VM48_VIBMT|nr:hypothetical protein XV92_01575 [Vibrio metoecus]